MPGNSGQIQANSVTPQSATVDGLNTTMYALKDQIAADRYGAATAAASSVRRGLRFSKLLPAGAMSDQQSKQPYTGFDNFWYWP
jgi:hypothetical protein